MFGKKSAKSKSHSSGESSKPRNNDLANMVSLFDLCKA